LQKDPNTTITNPLRIGIKVLLSPPPRGIINIQLTKMASSPHHDLPPKENKKRSGQVTVEDDNPFLPLLDDDEEEETIVQDPPQDSKPAAIDGQDNVSMEETTTDDSVQKVTEVQQAHCPSSDSVRWLKSLVHHRKMRQPPLQT
jgi:hypothetical protein